MCDRLTAKSKYNNVYCREWGACCLNGEQQNLIKVNVIRSEKMYIKRGFVAFTRRTPDHDTKMLFSLSYVKSTSCDL